MSDIGMAVGGGAAIGSGQSVRAWRDWLCFGALAIGLLYLLPGLRQDVLYDSVRLLAALITVQGVRLQRPERPGPWYLLAAGQLLFGLGDIVSDVVKYSGADPLPS